MRKNPPRASSRARSSGSRRDVSIASRCAITRSRKSRTAVSSSAPVAVSCNHTPITVPFDDLTRKRASLECFLALDPSLLLELDADRHLFRSHAVHHRDLFFDFGKIERLGGGRGYGGYDTVFFLLQRIE